MLDLIRDKHPSIQKLWLIKTIEAYPNCDED
jgi:hypothetical protein